MRIKLDENMPAALAKALAGLGHDPETVLQEGLTGRPDEDIFTRAQKEGRFLITQDLDFSNIQRFAPGSHHGLLVVRLRRPGRRALTERVRDLFSGGREPDWQGCFVVVTDRKLRIRRPPYSPA